MNWPAFVHPWMLAALAAVGLPVLIHYLTRARPRRISFPPFKFLVEACAGQQAVHRLRTFVLLSLRCLAVLALAFLFAQPFLKPSGPANSAQSGQHVVLLLDASLSMRAVQGGVPLFARAKSEAADVLRGLESGSEAAVVLAGAAPRALLPALSRNLPALHEELVKTEPSFETGDIGAALALAKRLLGGPGTIYIFSDFQKSNWETFAELPAGAVCRLRPVTTGPVENLAITAARLSPAEPLAGENAELACTVFNCTPRPREEILRLELGEFVQERRLSVPAYGTADADFTVIFPHEGFFSGKVFLPPDDLREDNSRYIAVRVHKTLQLLLVSDADAGDHRSAAFFVARALAPSAQTAPGLNIVRRHSQDTDRGVLETADVFLLSPPASLSGEAVEIISRRVQEGARLLSILDGPTAPLFMPAALKPPIQLQRTLVSEAGEPLVQGPYKLFADSDPADWPNLRFHRHYQNQVLEGRRNEVMLAFPDGSAALTLSSVGQGRAVFVNLPLTPDGGDFIGSPLFPATMHELLRALRRSSEEHVVTPGTAWIMETPSKGETAVTIIDPENQPVASQVISSGRTARLALPAARLPGIYLAKQAGESVGGDVVNLDPRESDTRPIALDQIKRGENASVQVIGKEDDLSLLGKSRPLWPQLLAAAAVMLALEMTLLALWRPRTSFKLGGAT